MGPGTFPSAGLLSPAAPAAPYRMLDDTGYTRATVLPYRTNDATGEQELALPGLLASPMQAWMRLLDAARAGQTSFDPIDALEVAGSGVTGGLLAPVRNATGLVLGSGPVVKRTANPVEYGVPADIAARIAGSYYGTSGPNPKKLARSLLGQDAPPDAVARTAEFAGDVRSLKSQRLHEKPGALDPLVLARDFARPRKLEDLKKLSPLNSIPWIEEIPGDALKAARLEAVLNMNYEGSLARGYLDAMQREFEKAGWSARHISVDKDGSATSRYMVSPDGARQIRLSDHELPIRHFDKYEGQTAGRWRGDQYVVDGPVADMDAPSVVVQGLLNSF